MSKISRRTVLAGVPAIAASVPAIAGSTAGVANMPLLDLEPSDPALAERWRGMFPRVMRSYAALIGCDESDFDDGEGPVNREWVAAHDELLQFLRDLGSAPPRTFGDVCVHAIIARHVSFDDDEHFESNLRSAYWDELGPAHVIQAVLRLAGLPTDRQAIAEKLEALS